MKLTTMSNPTGDRSQGPLVKKQQAVQTTPDEALVHALKLHNVRFFKKPDGSLRVSNEGGITEDSVCRIIAQLPNVSSLNLAGHLDAQGEDTRMRITDAGFAQLSPLKELRELRLIVRALTPVGFRTVENFHKIEDLEIRVSFSLDGAAASIRKLSQLRKVLLVGAGPEMSASGVRHLGDCRALESVELWTPGELDGFEAWARCKNLRSIGLEGCRQVGNRAMTGIAQIPSLEELVLGNCRVTDDALPSLAGLPKLRMLLIGLCPLTPKAMDVLPQFKTLESLFWPMEALDADRLSLFAEVPKLSALDIRRNRPLTPKEEHELKQLLERIRNYVPKCDVSSG